MDANRFEQRGAEGLMDEIRRYLAVVNVFRAEGCELRWLPEYEPRSLQPPRARRPERAFPTP
jgi:hypothetical protein